MKNNSLKHHLVAALIQPIGMATTWFSTLYIFNKFTIPNTLTRHKISLGSLIVGILGSYFVSQKYLELVSR